MELKSIALAAISIALLIAGLVESSGRKRKHENVSELRPNLFSPLVEDPLASPHRKRNKKGKKHSPKREASLVLVENPIANSPEGQRFAGAVQKGRMRDALHVFNEGNSELRSCCGKYLISLGLPKFVDLIKCARDNIKEWLLEILFVHVDQPLVDEVLTELKPLE